MKYLVSIITVAVKMHTQRRSNQGATTYLKLSIFAAICCCFPIGALAVHNSLKVLISKCFNDSSFL